jgi:hypothetical protein
MFILFRPRVCGVLVVLAVTAHVPAQGPIHLEEKLATSQTHQVSVRVEVTGTLTPAAEPGKAAPRPVAVRGDSALEYVERVLALSGGQAVKTIRLYERMDFRRTVDGVAQSASLRPSVRRLVLMREGQKKAPFSPDGPLLWDEIDQVRTDVSAPSLTGLLPGRAVRPGETWEAAQPVLLELTDIVQLDGGKITCVFERVAERDRRRIAVISLSGEVRGASEDGPTQHLLKGQCELDLDAGFLSYVAVSGVQVLLRDGREVGRVEGRFVLSRRPAAPPGPLNDEAIRALDLEPGPDNTRLLYDNAELGLRFLYTRRWHVAAARGSQVALDSVEGRGVLLTVEPLDKVPSGAQYLAESREFLAKNKAKVVQAGPVRQLAPGLEAFTIDAEVGGQRVLMAYFVMRQADGGVVIAARLGSTDEKTVLPEVERLARTLVVTKRIVEKR